MSKQSAMGFVLIACGGAIWIASRLTGIDGDALTLAGTVITAGIGYLGLSGSVKAFKSNTNKEPGNEVQ